MMIQASILQGTLSWNLGIPIQNPLKSHGGCITEDIRPHTFWVMWKALNHVRASNIKGC